MTSKATEQYFPYRGGDGMSDAARITPREAVSALEGWRYSKGRVKAEENAVARHRKIIEAYLEQEGETEFIDAETGFGVRYQQKTAAPTYDTVSMPQDMILHLHQLGALQVNHKLASELAQTVMGLINLKSFQIPGAVSQALVEVTPSARPA